MIPSDVHTVEVCVAIMTLDFINLELQLPPWSHLLLLLWSIAVVERDADHTSSKVLTGLHLTLCLVTRHQRSHTLLESWNKDIVPLLLGEWMRPIHSQKQSKSICVSKALGTQYSAFRLLEIMAMMKPRYYRETRTYLMSCVKHCSSVVLWSWFESWLDATYFCFLAPLFLKFLGFFPAVIDSQVLWFYKERNTSLK